MQFRFSYAFFFAAFLAPLAHADQPGGKPRLRRPVVSPMILPPAPLVGGSDTCATPDPIGGTGLFAFDNTAATTGAQGQVESLCNEFGFTAVKSDVWFVWTAPASGIAHVTTVNQTIVDTKIAAYPSGGCPIDGSALACDDDDTGSSSFQSTIEFGCTAGVSYLLQVGLYPGPQLTLPGTGNLSISILATAPNDACTSATVVTGFGPAATHAYDTTAATTGAQGQNNVGCESFATRAIDVDVWFTWTATLTGWVKCTTCAGATTDTKIAVYSGAGCPVAEPLACDDDACGTIGGASEARWFANAGTVYTIQLGAFPNTPGGPGFFTIESFTPALGDACSAPILIAGSGPHAFDDRQATTGIEGQSDVLCTSMTDPNPRITFDVWYQWTAPSTGMATWSLCAGSTMDSKIAVYAGAGCPSGPALDCNDDACFGSGPSAVTFPVTAGQPYVLQLGDWPGAVPSFGTFTVSVGTRTGTVFCSGDGSGTACPCSPSPIAPGVAQNGCPNSIYAGGASLWVEGNASVSSDTLQLRATGMPIASCLYFQGTTRVNSGLGGVFGDGLRCAGGTVQRLGLKMNVAGSSAFPVAGDLPVSVRGVIPPGGGVRTYQAWYRNAAFYCSASTFNTSNGVEVTWTP